jgi:ribA/ribD-fused uncharacterized protein
VKAGWDLNVARSKLIVRLVFFANRYVSLLLAMALVASPVPLFGEPPAKIDSFQGSYRFLSNFWPAEVVYEGVTFPSAEHAYQAAKSLSPDERKRIAGLPTPGEAKKEGGKLERRADWEEVKFQVMEECVRYKFTHHPELKAQLLATGDAELIEGNDWGDKIWGVSHGEGENRLGKILMKIRTELRTTP